jgi:uncharacterized membrane protein
MKRGIAIRLLVLCTAVFFIAAAFPVVSQAADPSIKINPCNEKPKKPITIEGSGFNPGEMIDITLDLGDGILIGLGTQKVEGITADDKGAFSAKSAVPAVAKPGTYKITVEGEKGSVAEAELNVQ